jgi:uncharacterized protein
MDGITFLKKPRLRNPYLIAAWPGMGDVAFKAASFLVEHLRAEEFAHIDPGDHFYLTGTDIVDGIVSVPSLPQSSFYYWKNKRGQRDLIIFLCNSQPDLSRGQAYTRKILHVARMMKAQTVIGLASMPQAIDHTQQPSVWCCATSIQVKEMMQKHSINVLSEGAISGMNGLFIGLAKQDGFDGFCLLGEIPLYTIQIENPKSSCVVLESLSSIIGIPIDIAKLRDQAQYMENEINQLIGAMRANHSGQINPINEEEVEKIKKALSHLTKLPGSVKDKIEKLFEEARIDAVKARELKTELDRWNVYKEYEDRFLDLFRKN